MPPRPAIYTIVAVAILTLFGYSAVRGHTPATPSEWLAPLGPAVTIAALTLIAFNRWVWRWPGVRKLHGRPLLHGTWHGHVASSWSAGGQDPRGAATASVFLVIRQKFWDVSVRLITAESSSRSLIAGVTRGPDGVCELIYVYGSTPQAGVRERSAPHHGSSVLTAPSDPSEGLHGQYFTDRNTTGDMHFPDRYKKLIESYAAGEELIGLPKGA